MTRPTGRGRVALALGTVLTVTACGLPAGGSTQRVDDDLVPYRLLESDGPSPGTAGVEGRPGSVPVVFWLSGDLLVPEATDDECTQQPEDVLARQLDLLTAGPSDAARAAGRSSAIPTDSGLELAGLDDETVTVEFAPETSLSADRLPLAVGQLVLTLTSAPGVDSVLLVSDGESVQAPLPGGALTDGPVGAAAYVDLLPERFARRGGVGCDAG